MRAKEEAPGIFAQPRGAQGRDDRDEPVDHDGQPRMRRAEEDARHRAQVEAADLAQNVDRIVRVRPVDGQRLFDHLFFSAERRVGQSAAAAGHGLDEFSAERAEDGGRGRRVADAHLADTEQADAVLSGLRGQLHAGQNALHRGRPRHGGAGSNVGGALAETPVQDLRAGIGQGDAHVDDRQSVVKVLRQARRAGQAARQVDGLRARDRLRRRRDALADHAVVGGQHIDAGGGGFVFDGPRDAREADGNLFKQPKAAGRLGQRVLPGFCLAHGRFVQGADSGKQALQPLLILCHTITPIVPVLRASEGSGGPA